MFLKVARAIARPQTFAILDLLKRSSGLSVNEIAKSLKLSYMGVKQYCNELHKKGLVDTWRRPKEVGRPELSYRLTAKAGAFYPEVGNELSLDILESAQQLYGSTAPDKLLYNFFAKKTEAYLKKIKGTTTAERATAFAKLRDQEGYCAQIEIDAVEGFRVVEFHSLLKEVGQKYPSVLRMEEMMFSRILGVPVQRSEQHISGLSRMEFLVAISADEFGALIQTLKPVVVEPEIEAEEPAEIEAALPELDEVECESEELAEIEQPVAEESAPEVLDEPIEVIEAIEPAEPELVETVSEEPIVEAEEPEVVDSIQPEPKKISKPEFKPEAEQIEFLLVG